MALFHAERWPRWFKAHAWRACVLERAPEVRILSSPPDLSFFPTRELHPVTEYGDEGSRVAVLIMNPVRSERKQR